MIQPSVAMHLKAKPPEFGDLYDVITKCGVVEEHLRLRLRVKAAGVHMLLHKR